MRKLIAWVALIGSPLCISCLAGAEVANGDFETGDLSGWIRTGQADVQSDVVRNGSYAAYIGTVDFDGDDKNDFTGASGVPNHIANYLFQQVDVGLGMTTLDIWYNVFTWDCAQWDDPAFEIWVWGTQLTVSANEIRATCQPLALGNTGWQLFSHDISEFAGGIIWLYIYAGNDATGGTLQSWAYVDDIVIHAPEPTSALGLGAGLLTIACIARRQRQRIGPG